MHKGRTKVLPKYADKFSVARLTGSRNAQAYIGFGGFKSRQLDVSLSKLQLHSVELFELNSFMISEMTGYFFRRTE